MQLSTETENDESDAKKKKKNIKHYYSDYQAKIISY